MITLINGHVQNASNLAVPNGSLELTLNTDATVIAPPYGQVMGNIPLFFQFDANANLAANSKIWSNIELNPQNPQGIGTWYLANFYDANGARINSVAQQWQFTQVNGSTVDIGLMTSTSQATIYYPAPYTQGNTVGGTAWINAKADGAFGDGLAAPLCGHMAIGSTTLTLNTTIQNGNGCARFLPAHVGYQIVVPFAAASSRDLYTTIATYVSPTQVTLSVANGSGKVVNNVDILWWPAGRDDTTALQGAINTASETAAILYLPAGVYPISASLTNSPLLRGIIGDGGQTSWLVSNSAANTSPALVMTDVPWRFQLHGIGFKGRGQAVASGTENGVEFRLTQSTGVTLSSISNLRILGYPGHGLYIQEPIAASIADSLFDDVGNTGLYVDVGGGSGFGGTSCVISGCYSYDNSQAYYLNNLAYSSMIDCAADSNNTNYWLVNCASVSLINCGSEVSLGVGTIGYVISGGVNNALYNCYWTKVPATDGVGVAISGTAVGTIIDGFYSNQPVITPLVDISIGASAVNTIIRNLKSTATTPVNDSGTGTLQQLGNTFSGTVNFSTVALSTLSGAATFNGTITYSNAQAGVPSANLNSDWGSDAKAWANIWAGNFQSFTDYRLRANGTFKFSSTSDPSGTPDTGYSRGAANTHCFGNGNPSDFSGVVQAKRLDLKGGTTLVSGDFAISAGWGNTASLAITNLTSKDTGGEVTVTSNGTGLAANPTVVLTFHDGSWGNAPAVIVSSNSVVGSNLWAATTVTATTVTFTYIGTPAGAGQVYSFSWIAQGT